MGSNWPIRANVRPYRAAFSSTHRISCDQPAPATDLAVRVRILLRAPCVKLNQARRGPPVRGKGRARLRSQ